MQFQEQSLAYYQALAKIITSYEDYRMRLVHQGHGALLDCFILEAKPTDQQDFIEAIEPIGWSDNMMEFLELPADEKKEKLKEQTEFYNKIQEVIQKDDFIAYMDLMIETEEKEVEKLEKLIVTQEESVVENPDLEDSVTQEIERLQREIEMIESYRIPAWEYRKERKINPSENTWQESALMGLESAVYDLQSAQDIMTEQEFSEDPYNIERYKNYNEYLESMKIKENKALVDIEVAKQSLETEKPDMKFVYNGARGAVNSNLGYSLIVAFLAILVGGIGLATEFQSGTIRLLMIRPRTRMKVYMSRFIAGLGLCLSVYIVGTILNVLCNGIILGFDDFAYPIYMADGKAMNFWLILAGRVFACMTSVIFAYAVAYAFSAIVRNAAVSIALPSVMVFGGIIVTSMVAYSQYAKLLVYTPLPYLNMAQFYTEYGIIDNMARNGVECSASTGVVMLLVLAVLFIGIGMFSFKKRDITN